MSIPAISLSARCWDQAIERLAGIIAERGIHPAEVVVLLPYAQLIQHARQTWAAKAGGTFFVPRFETTMNWASGLGGTLGMFTPSGVDLRMDVSVDMLTATALLAQAGLAAQQDALAGRLVEAAWSLSRVAASVLPAERQAWSESVAEALGVGLDSPVLALEAAVGRIALAWVAASGYASDRLFQAAPALFVVIEGFQVEPVNEALKRHLGEQALSIDLCLPPGAAAGPSTAALHAARDAEDEAARAAACVLAHLNAGRSPVALIAQDRQLTRRAAAMLAQRGIVMRDETGWTLSTARAAAGLMGLLRALPWDASADAVLDWLKNAPAFPAGSVAEAETELRSFGVRAWRDLPATPLEALAAAQLLARQVNGLRAALSRPRPLAAWLRDLRAALQSAGQWAPLEADEAGQRVLDVLRLHEGAEHEFGDAPVMKQRAFTSWVNQALEAQTFSPEHPVAEQVVILPLAQLLGRAMQAVVLPGCDEIRLPVSPEPPGHWTASQRELLGLPTREALARIARHAWDYAMELPHVDVLWRTSEAGEHLMPSGFVQELLLQRHPWTAPDMPAPDPRRLRAVAAQPTARPLPSGQHLPVAKLSASGYGDLRACPYRFFAMRQLGLAESGELEGELDKRDFGNWLHSLLCTFHEALKEAPAHSLTARVAMINIAADKARKTLGLSDSEFMPFAAAWVPVRDGYLAWLAGHEAEGAAFDMAEQWLQTPLGGLTLVGKIDRMDRLPGGQRLLIDYKTEPRGTTAGRIKQGLEDTQLAFYAALVPDDTLAAAYVNLGEKEATRAYGQPEIVALRDALIEGILHDMARIAQGHPLRALGEGAACGYCAARGLCRKDFWSETPSDR